VGGAESVDDEELDDDSDEAGVDAEPDAAAGRFESLLHAVSGTTSKAAQARTRGRRGAAIGAVCITGRPDMSVRDRRVPPVVFDGCPRRRLPPIRRCSTRS
jgi:hypothetical protein